MKFRKRFILKLKLVIIKIGRWEIIYFTYFNRNYDPTVYPIGNS